MTKIKLSLIPENGKFEEKGLKLKADELGLGPQWEDNAVEFSYDLQKIYGKILGNFHAKGRLALTCSRCLNDFSTEATTEFVLEFEPEPEEFNPRSGPDPSDPELNVIFFKGDSIEFSDELRQELELLIPFAPVCRNDCRGLCAVCGGNRNETACSCEVPQSNNPFLKLNQLFQKNKEN